MDSPIVDDLEPDIPPRKKLKVLDEAESAPQEQVKPFESVKDAAIDSNTSVQLVDQKASTDQMDSVSDIRTSIAEAETEQMHKEITVGIEAFVSEDPGFQGILKRRYHDFLVNEIMPNGKVARLDDPEMLQVPAVFLSKGDEDEQPATSTSSTNDKSMINNHKRSQVTDPPNSNSDDASDQAKAVSDATQANVQVDPELQSIRDIATSEGKDIASSQSLDLTLQNFEQLKKFFDMDQIKKLATMFKDITQVSHKNPAKYGSVESQPVDDKKERKNAHQIIRTVFCGRIETAHQDGNTLHCTAAASALSRKGKANNRRRTPGNRQMNWESYGGEYMHFTLYKENRDSSDVLGYLASRLNLKSQKVFEIAGNKDRRAVTVQRVSANRIMADRFLHLNNIMKQSLVGDCSYSKNKLQLGDLAGNEFIITLRDCAVRIPKSSYTTIVPQEIDQSIRQGMQNLREKGFINYFGLQRFGSFATRTDSVGQYMINGNYEAAVKAILDFSEFALEVAEADDNDEKVSSDDKKRAQAINWFKTKSKDIKTILDTLPRRFTAEHAIVSFLGKSKDQSNPYYRGALEAIPRGFRLLYPHAYQSLIWNLAATHRWRLAPGKLLAGDLVLAHRSPNQKSTFQTTRYDAHGDPIFEPGHHDRASIHEQYEGGLAYVLTEEDIASDRFSIFDIVLPQPGHNVLYPAFMLDFYKTTMAQHGGIDPSEMRRNWREVSLPGAYRKLLGRPFENWSFEQVWYDEEEAKIALTDLERLEAKQQQQKEAASVAAKASSVEAETKDLPALNMPLASGIVLAAEIPRGNRLAIVLKFQLPSSTYATMALRELMKPGPVEYKPEFSAGRYIKSTKGMKSTGYQQ